MDGFERRREQKKKDILQAAMDLFMTYGPEKVSIAEIASKANVSQVTIYNYFGNKHNLIEEMIVYSLRQIWSEYETLFDSDLPFIEKVRKSMFHKIQSATAIHPDAFVQFIKKYNAGVPVLETFMQEKIMPKMMALIEEGKRDGYVDPDLSDEAVLMFIQMFREFMQKEEVYPHLQRMTGDLTKLFFYGLVGSKDNLV